MSTETRVSDDDLRQLRDSNTHVSPSLARELATELLERRSSSIDVERVKVKALEWEDWWSAHANISGTTKRRIMERALTAFGAYFIEQSQDDDSWWLLDRLLGDEIGGPFEHDWQVREAADKHFASRILSALSTPPLAVQDGADWKWKAIAVLGRWAIDVSTIGELEDLERRLNAVGVGLEQIGGSQSIVIVASQAIDAGDGGRLSPARALQFIADEAKRANDIIALNRDGGAQGRVNVATAMHRIAHRANEAITALSHPAETVSVSDEIVTAVSRDMEVRNMIEAAGRGFMTGSIGDSQEPAWASEIVKTILRKVTASLSLGGSKE